jgi:Sec7-like guanine-nucleotide exchange factor
MEHNYLIYHSSGQLFPSLKGQFVLEAHTPHTRPACLLLNQREILSPRALRPRTLSTTVIHHTDNITSTALSHISQPAPKGEPCATTSRLELAHPLHGSNSRTRSTARTRAPAPRLELAHELNPY